MKGSAIKRKRRLHDILTSVTEISCLSHKSPNDSTETEDLTIPEAMSSIFDWMLVGNEASLKLYGESYRVEQRCQMLAMRLVHVYRD